MSETIDPAAKQYPAPVPFFDHDIDTEFERHPGNAFLELAKIAPVVSGRNGVIHGHRIPNYAELPDADQDLFYTMNYEAWRGVVSKNKSFSSTQGWFGVGGPMDSPDFHWVQWKAADGWQTHPSFSRVP